jgi:xylitol oxidase
LTETNWAGSHVYAGRVVRPAAVEELQELVAASTQVGFLGSRHSFNAIADADVLVDMRALPQHIAVDAAARRATVSGATTYGALAVELEAHGLALANLASLPHISVAGAIATGTHGAGVRNGSLATAVTALDIMRGDGEVVRVERGDPDFAGCVVHLGALGAVVGVELELEPTYRVRQWVRAGIPWPAIADELHAVLGAASSVSLFTLWDGRVRHGWFKERVEPTGRPPDLEAWGTAETRDVHPLPGLDPVHATPQLGRPGPWFDRLAHFRIGFVPSDGDELQSEYLVERAAAPDAIRALDAIGAAIRPVLQISEVRAVAADALWMSPAFGRGSVAFHFTWRQEPERVAAAVDRVEAALRPLGARPHWGKVFRAPPAGYPRRDDFAALARRMDPDRTFTNPWLERHVFATTPTTT